MLVGVAVGVPIAWAQPSFAGVVPAPAHAAQAEARTAYTLAPGVQEMAEIRALYLKYVETFRARDLDAFLAVFADDAAYLRPGDALYRGREEIQKVYQPIFAATKSDGSRYNASFHIVQRVIGGDMVADIGYANVEVLRPNQPATKVSVQIAFVFKRAGRHWRLQVQSYSTYKAGGEPG